MSPIINAIHHVQDVLKNMLWATLNRKPILSANFCDMYSNVCVFVYTVSPCVDTHGLCVCVFLCEHNLVSVCIGQYACATLNTSTTYPLSRIPD